jgi:hypothetical protein
MPKPLKAGGEVDSWCTKCRLVLNHRIIAMVGPKPARVECSTCGSHHNYRGHAPGEKPASSASSSSSSGAPRAARTVGAGSSSRARGPNRAEQDRLDREKQWEKSIAGKSPRDFKPYRVSLTFQNGDLIRHSKFGDGVVTRIVDAHKVEILFKDEARTLAQSLTD